MIENPKRKRPIRGLMRHCYLALCILGCSRGTLMAASGHLAESSFSIDAGGGWSENTDFLNRSVIGQPWSTGLGVSSSYRNHSGFLNTFVAHPHRDADVDGIADENDPDDDNDGLEDHLEQAGSLFHPEVPTDPMRADSDGDGHPDGAERVSGTNPTDPYSLFAVTWVRYASNIVTLGWSACGGKTYEVLRAESLEAIREQPVVLERVIAQEGRGPWHEAFVERAYPRDTQNEFYRVKVLP